MENLSWAWHGLASAAPTLKLERYTEDRRGRSVKMTRTPVQLFEF